MKYFALLSYAGDLWTAGRQGGMATRLTVGAGMESSAAFPVPPAKFSYSNSRAEKPSSSRFVVYWTPPAEAGDRQIAHAKPIDVPTLSEDHGLCRGRLRSHRLFALRCTSSNDESRCERGGCRGITGRRHTAPVDRRHVATDRESIHRSEHAFPKRRRHCQYFRW